MFVKRMLYYTGDGQGLLPALGVTLVCHASIILQFTLFIQLLHRFLIIHFTCRRLQFGQSKARSF